jgi:hypothetical protein
MPSVPVDTHAGLLRSAKGRWCCAICSREVKRPVPYLQEAGEFRLQDWLLPIALAAQSLPTARPRIAQGSLDDHRRSVTIGRFLSGAWL